MYGNRGAMVISPIADWKFSAVKILKIRKMI